MIDDHASKAIDMYAILVDGLRSVGEALARSLASISSIQFHAVSSIDEAVDLSSTRPADFIVLTRSVCRDCSQLSEIALRFPQGRLVFLDDAVDWNRARASIDAGLSGYLCKSLALAELVESFHHLSQGERVFAPEVAERLMFSVKGIKLVPPEPTLALSILTPREIQVLRLITRGLSVRECAAKLGISQSTVDNHKSRLMAKLKIHKTTELVHFALREGVISDDYKNQVDS